jgi:SAM-dependent methyltransferase
MSAALAAALAGRAARSGDATKSAIPPHFATNPTSPREAPAQHSSSPEPSNTTAGGWNTGGGGRMAGDVANGGAAVGDGGLAAAGGVASGQSAGGDAADGWAADGGMSTAGVMSGGRVGGGGTLVLVDAVPELLAAATEAARSAAGVAGVVNVHSVRADLAAVGRADGLDTGTHISSVFGDSLAGLPAADLVWASNVAHHLPDQRAMVSALAAWLAPGGCLALAEGGLSMRCLPWDLGVGEPGLQDRLIAAHGTWFHRMRTEMPGAVRLPVGWNVVLAEAGLTAVTAFSYLVDVPAPLTDTGRAAVVSWLAWMTKATRELLTPSDLTALERLLDLDDPAYVGRRDDVFLLKASTVHLGWRR